MTKDDAAMTIVIFVAMAILLALALSAVISSRRIEAERIENLKQIMAHYNSPVVHTDAERLDWLTAHPKESPWTKYETDPRREIDFAIDNEQEPNK